MPLLRTYAEHTDTVYTTARYGPAYTVRGNWGVGRGGEGRWKSASSQNIC